MIFEILRQEKQVKVELSQKEKTVSKVDESLIRFFFLTAMGGQGATGDPEMITDGGAAGGEEEGQTGTAGGQQAGDPASSRVKRNQETMTVSFYGFK